ncbi:MAG: aquaporin, partial [Chloroflexia bacterium]|nr:aquaporin [Chloroflexia bacterium]
MTDERRTQDSTGGNMIRAAVAELVGTFFLVLIGTGVACAAILRQETAGPPYDSLAIALSFGLVLVAIVAALGQVSGAHVNPAVTLGLAAAGKFPWRYVPAYLVAQVAGAVLAALAVWGAYGQRARDLAA